MLSRANVTPGALLRPGPGIMVFLLVGLLLSGGPVPQRLESWYYDWLQRLQDRPASERIVLVDTAGLETAGNSTWASAEFPALLSALKRAGAALIVPAQAPPPEALLPDAGQLVALAELEQRTRQANGLDGTASQESSKVDDFAAQLATIRQQAARQAQLVETISTVGNMVIPVAAADRHMPTTSSQPCGAHAIVAASAAEPALPVPVRRRRGLEAPADGVCRAALGLGHVEFWSDADGVVRRTELLVQLGAETFPAIQLAAALAAGGVSAGTPLTVSPGRIESPVGPFLTSGGTAMLNRFYPATGGLPPFPVARAEEVLAGSVRADVLSGRIAVVGSMRETDTTAFPTPVAAQMPTTLLIATGLSNLLESDQIVRPSRLAWAEAIVGVLIGAALLAWGPALAPAVAVMSGVVVAVVLLGAEAYLLIGSPGVWVETVGLALFSLFGAASVHLLRPRAATLDVAPATTPAPRSTATPNADEELDLSFSVLRQQTPSPAVKQRLYDLALEHARRRDLARAERVLRHLASLDPGYRGVGEKLQKLAGLRASTEVRPAAPAPAQPPAASSGAPIAERTLGRYALEQIIGRGAMATVYLGRDPTINRKVAVKTIALAQEFGDSELANARAQFIREAESAGRLNHPGIITIYDVGEDGQTAYLAMEYFAGQPLSHYVQQGRLLAAARVLDLMARAADALHYAHGQHVVHRDIKPANLLYDERSDTLKITDFGIARLTDTSRTKTGIILGTPSYMSPEQLAGQGVTGQSDLFSLGVTTYQLLAGAPPFRADSIPHLMQKIAHEPHEPLRHLREDLPPGVDQILDRALAKEPADRFASGREMALALRDCCNRSISVPAARIA